MWQFLVAAAAAAGSGILAKKFMNPIDNEKPVSNFNPNEEECAQNQSLPPQDSIFPFNDAGPCPESSSQGKMEPLIDDIFRFSSPETGSMELKMKIGNGIKKNGAAKREKRSGKRMIMDQRGSGKRVSVCLKKRRTGKNAPGKCESCISKDNSFGWGVGLGIMYMMSAGKSEISRLNIAMDETTKIVHELKSEISGRKSSISEHALVGKNEAHIQKIEAERSCSPSSTNSCFENKDKVKRFGPSSTEDREFANALLSEEQQPEVLEMDQLEAELECELQKLPGCATEGSGSEDVFENSNSYQTNGVMPAELDKKLCKLLIEQQENQIFELEHALNQAQSKLHEKEAELRALKDCVKRLTEFSITSVSDEETDVDMKSIQEIEEDQGFEPIQSVVGMKRGMAYETYSCHGK